MFFKFIFLAICLFAFAAALPVDYVEDIFEQAEPVLVRHVRSPGDGSLDIGYKDDQSGRTASVQYNQNLYKTDDGRLTVDAYAYGNRNFDYNRNDYGGGLQGSYHFG